MIESVHFLAVPAGTLATIRVRVVDRAAEVVDGFRQLVPNLEARWQQRFEVLRGVINEDAASGYSRPAP